MSWDELHNKSEIRARITLGDVDAFNVLYEATSDVLFSVVNAFVKQPETAEDIVQLTYLKIWEKREQMGEINDLGKYLFVLARNASFDHLKKKASQYKMIDALSSRHEEYSNNILEELNAQETKKAFEKALSKLPPRQLHAYKLSSEEELSHSEIAEKMDISPYTVRHHLDAARQSIRNFMNEHLDVVVIILTGALYLSGLTNY